MQEELFVDKLIQGLEVHKNGEFEDPYLLYSELLDSLRYGKSMKECVGIHIIENIFRFYYDDYKWYKSCDYTLCDSTSAKKYCVTKRGNR